MKKKSSGFTLPEILVASLITIILLGAVGSVFLTSLNLFSRSEAIANKSGTITNVETNLQNKLAVASEVKIASSPAGPYSIGFDSNGLCQEVIKKDEEEDEEEDIEYTIDQLSEIILKVDGNMLKYELEAKDGMSTLKGGIILNNIDDVSSQEGFAENFEAGTKEIQLKPEKSLYLLIK